MNESKRQDYIMAVVLIGATALIPFAYLTNQGLQQTLYYFLFALFYLTLWSLTRANRELMKLRGPTTSKGLSLKSLFEQPIHLTRAQRVYLLTLALLPIPILLLTRGTPLWYSIIPFLPLVVLILSLLTFTIRQRLKETKTLTRGDAPK